MKTVKIGFTKHPIIRCMTRAEVDISSDSVQCIEEANGRIAAYFFRAGDKFSDIGETAKEAAEKVALQVQQYDEDCRIVSVEIDGFMYPVRPRRTLMDNDSGIEKGAPIGIVHWWLKGTIDDTYYKCDIHFPDDNFSAFTIEGIGKTLAKALEDISNY